MYYAFAVFAAVLALALIVLYVARQQTGLIRRRQEVYSEQTKPLIEVYRSRGIVFEVDGMGAVDEVTRRIFDALDVVSQS